MASSSAAQDQVFVGPGLSPFKRIMTAIGVLIVTAIVLWIAIHEGLSALGSTITAIIFILGFVIYLRIIAPVPFTIELNSEALIKRGRNGEVIELPWDRVTRIKEEFFPNGKRIGITVYDKPAPPPEKAKARAVYREDVTATPEQAHAPTHAIPRD